MIVGVDEAGRGPLAGPVVACALSFKNNQDLAILSSPKSQPVVSEAVYFVGETKRKKIVFSKKIKDSKQLSAFKREEAFAWIEKNAVFGVGIADHCEIDSLNILEATFLAFNRAISSLIKKEPNAQKATYIIDGTLFKNSYDLNFLCLKQADSRVKEVACASIVAKVFRDYLMTVIDPIYPEWNFNQHKGYGTREHLKNIEKYSLSPLHRKTFRPCQR